MKSIRLGFGVLLMLAALLLVGAPLFGGMAQAAGTPAGTPITFTAELTYNDGAEELPPREFTTTVTVKKVAGVSITPEDARSLYVKPGEAVTFLVKVANTGNFGDDFELEVDSVMMDPTIDWTVSIHKNNGGAPGAKIVNPHTIAMDDDVEVWVVFQAPEDGKDGNWVSAQLKATGTTGLTASSGEMKVTVTDTDLEVTISADKVRAVPGDDVTYTVTLDNLGTGEATGIALYIPIPEGSTYLDKSLTVPAGDGVECTVVFNEDDNRVELVCASLPGGGKIEFDFTVTIADHVAPDTPVGEDVEVDLSYKDTAGDTVNKTEPAPIVTVDTLVAVDVTPSVDQFTMTPGEGFTPYTFQVKNMGNVSDTYDLSKTSAPGKWTWVIHDSDDNPVSLTGVMTPGETKTFTLHIDDGTIPSAIDEHEEIVEITATSRENVSVKDTLALTITIEAANISGTLTASPNNPGPGDKVSLTLTVTNEGSQPAKDTKVELKIPTHVSYKPETIKVDGAQKTDAIDDDDGAHYDGTKVVVDLGDLDVGATVIITFDVTIN